MNGKSGMQRRKIALLTFVQTSQHYGVQWRDGATELVSALTNRMSKLTGAELAGLCKGGAAALAGGAGATGPELMGSMQAYRHLANQGCVHRTDRHQASRSAESRCAIRSARSHPLHRKKLRAPQQHDGARRHERNGHLPPHPGCVPLLQPAV